MSVSLELTTEELELLYMMRMEEYESIRVKMFDGKIERFEATELIKNETRIIDILKKGRYQSIEIKQDQGRIVQIKRTIRKKV